MEVSKGIKNEKKCEKKRRKCQHIVEKETGVTCVQTPTRNVAICNTGLVNGLTEEVLLEHFIKFGPIQNVLMPPGKSCCFISYEHLESAVKAFDNLDGVLNIAQNNKPIYLSYVQTIPGCSDVKEKFSQKPPGLIIIENFVTPEEESLLLSSTGFVDEKLNLDGMKNRFVKHYGYEFRYDTNNVDKSSPMEQKIPGEFDFLWHRLKQRENFNFWPNQLTINYYKPGQGIPPHVDTHSAFEDPIISLSLCSSTVMEFRHSDGRHCCVFLPRYSLAVMSGESRYEWTHGITPRKLDVVPSGGGLTTSSRMTRISFTFRKIRKGECECTYINNCDSYVRRKQITSDLAAKLEDAHVHEVYDNIASHFSDTRHKPWPNVLKFVDELQVGSVLVDVGCGNGKYFGHNKNIWEVGCDRSGGLIDLCKSRGFEVFTCNCLSIPIRNETADGVISIAVIHHLANEERRLQAIKEITRILVVNGRALIYVWAKDQLKEEKSSYIKQDRKNRKSDGNVQGDAPTENFSVADDIQLPVHTNRTQFKHQDVLVPWKLKQNAVSDRSDLYLRYYHVFEENELVNLCAKLKNIEIIESYYDQGNWCVIFQKIKP